MHKQMTKFRAFAIYAISKTIISTKEKRDREKTAKEKKATAQRCNHRVKDGEFVEYKIATKLTEFDIIAMHPTPIELIKILINPTTKFDDF